MASVGSILDGIKTNVATNVSQETGVGKADTVKDGKEEKDVATATYEHLQRNIDESLSKYMNNGIRLLGAPHQFMKQTDPRYGNSELGRKFAQKMMFEAPLVYMKPGVSEFLPGQNSKFRDGFLNAIGALNDESKKKSLEAMLAADEKNKGNVGKDTIRYYGIKPDYSGFMTHVNSLCRILATMEGLDRVRVPWTKGSATFGNYDWRLYRMESDYGNLHITPKGGFSFESMFKEFANTVTGNKKMQDFEYIRYYAQPESSYGTSFSNSTTGSMLESLTSQVEGMARELNTISAFVGLDTSKIGEATDAMASTISEAVNKYGSDGTISTGIKRITNTLGSVMLGGHIVLPEMWGGSSYDNDFSFSMTLSSPYGNKLSKYIHVGVPMMFLLASVLPVMQSPNVISTPYLFQCFMPGFFDSEMCMVTSLSFDKSTDGITMGNSLPSEVKVTVGIKDLYSSLSMPKAHKIEDWMSNTGMMEFLAVQAGVDISRQELNSNFKMFAELLKDSMYDHVQDTAYEIMMSFKHHAINWFKMIN